MRPLSILFAGLGSVGSKAAESLVRTALDPGAGFALERVALLDREVLEAANLTRHEALPEEVGERKVDLMARRLVGLAPGLEVVAEHASIFDVAREPAVERLVARADLVAATLDDARALFRLNALCVRFQKPLLIAEVISGGVGVWLHAANVAPGAPCLLDIARARGEDVSLAAVERDDGAVDYADPRASVAEARVPADDWACSFAASLLARELVKAARAGGVVPRGTPPLRLIALERVEDPRIGRFFRAPLQTTVVDVRTLAGCAECGARRAPTAAEHARNLAFFETGPHG